MTESQKEQVKEYRDCGYGYKKVAQMMGISENTIKTFCKRNGLGGIAGKPSRGYCVCQFCGGPIVQTAGRKRKKFCSDRCRNTWWNCHQELVNRKAHYNFICLYCKRQFTAYGNASRKYCSHECYVKDRFGGGSHE